MSFYDDASLIMYPSGYKEDKIYSLKPTDGSGDLTFTRASSATRVNAEGVIEEVPVNLLTYSEQFDNAAWTKSNATILSNATTAPNGTATAEKLVENSSNSSHFVGQSGQQLNNTYSIFAKKGERNWILLTSHWSSGSAYRGQFFDLENGVVGTGGSSNGNIENVGDGWYRCSIEANSSPQSLFSILLATSDGTTTYLGDGASGVYLWGAQNQNTNLSTYFPTTDRLNVPRIDYTGGGCGKLLLEPQRTNLVTYSSEFDNAVHTKLNVTITSNNTTSPDGTQNADKFTETTVTNEHILYDADSIASGTYTLSAFFKSGGGTIFPVLRLNGADATAYAGCIFNTSTGKVVNTFYNTYTAPTTKVENMGNGWYRVSMTTTTTNTFFGLRISASDSASPSFGAYGSINYTGSTSNYFYTYGAQLEQGSYPTSYIPTSGATVTRLADAVSKTGISSLIGQTEGTVFIDFLSVNNFNGNFGILFEIKQDNNNRINIYFSNGTPRLFGVEDTISLFNQALSLTIGSTCKLGIKYNSTSTKVFIDGSLIHTLSGINNIAFSDFSITPNNNINYKNLQIYNTALTDQELINLTTI